MNEKTVLLMILKTLQTAKNLPPWRAAAVYEKVRKLYLTYILLLQEQENVKKQRKFWVRPIFTHEMRIFQGASDNLVIEMQTTDREKYFNYFRMSPELFEELLTLVGPRIQKKQVCRIPISPRTRLQLTLRWLASGDSLASHFYAFRIAPNTASKIVKETCTSLWEVLKDRVFVQPTPENWQKIADEFEQICQFTNCIGSIDGKHIIIQVHIYLQNVRI